MFPMFTKLKWMPLSDACMYQWTATQSIREIAWRMFNTEALSIGSWRRSLRWIPNIMQILPWKTIPLGMSSTKCRFYCSNPTDLCFRNNYCYLTCSLTTMVPEALTRAGIFKCTQPSAWISEWIQPRAGISECIHPRACISKYMHPRACISECIQPRAGISKCTQPRACISKCIQPRACMSECTLPRADISKCTHPGAGTSKCI